MQIEPDPKENSRLHDSVVLIINGLSASGRVLAEMLARQGADVAIVDSHENPTLGADIRSDVRANGRRCLVLTPNLPSAEDGSFSQYAIQEIINTFGRLDAFISYSAADSSKANGNGSRNGRSQKPDLFDQEGLAKAALRHILAQNQA